MKKKIIKKDFIKKNSYESTDLSTTIGGETTIGEDKKHFILDESDCFTTHIDNTNFEKSQNGDEIPGSATQKTSSKAAKIFDDKFRHIFGINKVIKLPNSQPLKNDETVRPPLILFEKNDLEKNRCNSDNLANRSSSKTHSILAFARFYNSKKFS